MAGQGAFRLLMRDLKGAEAGEYTAAEISVDEPGGGVTLMAANSDSEGKFDISIDGRRYEVVYDKTALVPSGKIMDPSQFLTPDWEGTSGYGGGQTYEINTGVDAAKVQQNLFKRTQDNAVVSYRDHVITYNSSGQYVGDRYISNVNRVRIYASDENGSRTPRTYINFYGVCCFYKEFNVTLGAPSKLWYDTASGQRIQGEPIRMELKSGAQSTDIYSQNARVYFVNPNEPLEIVPTLAAGFVNGQSGMFGHVKGYRLTFDDRDDETEDRFTLEYPACVGNKPRYTDNLGRILIDEAMLELIEQTAVQKGVHTFHAGDTLDLTVTVDDPSLPRALRFRRTAASAGIPSEAPGSCFLSRTGAISSAR